MNLTTVYTKTAKGITQVNQKSASLSRDLMKVLKLIDGKSNAGQILERSELDKVALEKSLLTLTKDGFVRVFEVRKVEPDPFGDDDFDFTAPSKSIAPSPMAPPGQKVAAAANDISELVRQREKIEAETKAREMAQIQARAKAKSEMESRARLEAEAKAKADAEAKAMEQARKAKEAAERARADVESKLREEAARNRALQEQQAKLTTEQKAKEEEESRRLAEARMKAEAEAKALAEARARAEAEAAALAKARAAAETAAKSKAQDANAAEHELRARLKDEIEARIRGEMEQLLRSELEEKTRGEVHAQIMAEAKLAAQAELDERLQQERAALKRAELEVRISAEKAANESAEREAKLRAEAEARAAAETEARMKAEEENRRLRRMEARAREEADASAKEQAAMQGKLEAERRAKIEAQAKASVEAEERERRERDLRARLEQERAAKEAAEMKARVESRAREHVEQETRAKVEAELAHDSEKRAKVEGEAQAKAFMQAKKKAEQEEDMRQRAEQDRRAHEMAEILRQKVEPDFVEDEMQVRRPRPKKRNIVKTAAYSLFAFIVIAIGLLHVIPLRAFATKLEKGIGGWIHDDVSISSLTFSMIPTPHLKITGFAVGKQLDAKAPTGNVYLDIGSLFGEKLFIDTIELDSLVIGAEALKRVPSWGAVQGKSAAAEIAHVKLRSVKLDSKPVVNPFDATFDIDSKGVIKRVMLSGDKKWTVVLKPSPVAGAYALEFNAREWQLPMGAPVPILDVKLKGTLTKDEIVVPEFEADAMDGRINGTLKVNWENGFKLASDLSVVKLQAKELVGSFTRDVVVQGRVEGNFSVQAEAPTLETLLAAPSMQGKFTVVNGSISNLDLVTAMQSASSGGRGGVTKFQELSGQVAAASGAVAYSNVVLQGGVLRAGGNINVAPNSHVTGRLNVELRSNVAQDRGSFSLSGSVAKPQVARGG
jgi:hypothetical protein